MSGQSINKSEDDVLTRKVDPRIMRRLLSFFKPYTRYIVIATVLTILISALAALRPRLTPIAIDDKIMNKDFPGLQYIILIMFGTLVIQGIIQYAMTYLTSWIGQNIIYDLRKKIFDHIMTLDLKFFDKNPIGRVVTRVTGDVEVLFEVFSSGLVTAFGDVFLLIWILYFMFDLDFRLALATLSIIPILVIATAIFRKKVRESY
ncbi:MAG: ABC transporter ATP-binding protein, partial [Bacteroidota bacterium]|nr:ABC transporter ATP-binding protein [Bacteroidota bacterium]